MPDRAILGLGNPGARYAGTRHNAGFLVLERLAERGGLVLGAPARSSARWCDARLAGVDVRLVEPLVFMNRSGEVVPELVAPAALSPADLLVVHDELDLPFGTVRLKVGGGIAGHRGLASLVEHLDGDASFSRLRFGIGRPAPGCEVVDHVLAAFSPEEVAGLSALLDEGADACEAWLALGPEAAMNRVNARSRGSGPTAGARPGGRPPGTAGSAAQAEAGHDRADADSAVQRPAPGEWPESGAGGPGGRSGATAPPRNKP